MALRPIHLTSKNRIAELSAKFKVDIPQEWLGQILFEFKELPSEKVFALKEWLRQNDHRVLKVDAEQNFLLAKPNEVNKEPVFRPLPMELQAEWKRVTEFFKFQPPAPWKWGDNRILDFNNAPFIMGILNVTPDSFSDGGKFYQPQQAVRQALQMIEEGADIIDIGGESTRPGAEPVSAAEEIRRVVPVIEALRKKSDVLISVDTYKSEVARQALQAGADLVNDISGAQFDPDMPKVVKQAGCPLVIMHIKGTPRDMQKNPYYDDVVEELYGYFEKRLRFLQSQGIEMVAIDPGIGFGKRIEDNLKLLRDLKDFTFFNKPILIGTSRKSFIGTILDKEVNQRLFGSLATQVVAVQNGAHIVRVHDVGATKDALSLWRAINLA